MNKDALFTSNKQDWGTPIDFFNKLDAEFHFTLDVCANEQNHKCARYFNESDDGLSQDWSGEVVFCNPPYSPVGKIQDQWVKKCYEESKHATVVALLPARTDTKRFHEYILPHCEIRFVEGRIKFDGGKDPAPFPSMVCIFGRTGVRRM